MYFSLNLNKIFYFNINGKKWNDKIKEKEKLG